MTQIGMPDSHVAICGLCLTECGGPDEETAMRRMKNHRCPIGTIRDAANALADARVRYAREFGRLKLANPGMTDKAALLAATEATNDEVTRLEAELEIARRIT